MRGKTGAAHFEMIIGFVFFIGFVMFLFLFLSPWDNSSLPNSALTNLHTSFLENVGTNLSTVFVSTREMGKRPCYNIRLPSDLFEYAITDGESLVRVLGGDDVDSGLMDGDLVLSSSGDFFRVAISPEFEDEESNCRGFSDFDLGSVVEMKVVSYSKFFEMRKRYDSDYDGLKRDLGLADIFDFAIISEGLPNMTMEPSSEISAAIEILAKDYVVKVLRSNGAISNERISIRIW